MAIYFDDSLPALAATVVEVLGQQALADGLVLRDTTGRLAFLSAKKLRASDAKVLSRNLAKKLGPYARTDRVVGDVEDIGVRDLFDEGNAVPMAIGTHRLRLIDRRLVGADWLRSPEPASTHPPRFVFSSLKGGVGRSTALAVTAVALAQRGRRVLAIDLDLEAPGLGSFLLEPATLPEFGFIDALVEIGFNSLDERFLADLVGPSAISQNTGRVDVIPALGKKSLANPGEVLAKISRAYTETTDENGKTITISDQIRRLVSLFADSGSYEAILIDARAGLHETTPASILGLGAEVMLFGIDEPQTFQGYSILLAHMASFLDNVTFPPEWLERMTVVQAKAPADPTARIGFQERIESLFADAGLGRKAEQPTGRVPIPAEPFGNVPWDDDLGDDELFVEQVEWLPPIIAVLDDPRFRHVGHMRWLDLLNDDLFRSSYEALLHRVDEVMAQVVVADEKD